MQEGYKILEWVESTGSEYILTDLIPDSGFSFWIDFECLSDLNGSSFGCVFGARYISGNKDFQLTSYSAKYTAVMSAGTLRTGMSNTNNDAGLRKNERMICILKGSAYDTSFGYHADVSVGNVSPPCPIMIFALNQNGSATQHSKIRLFTLALGNSTRVVKYVPALRERDGVAGLYNVTDDIFIAPVGTLIAGPEQIFGGGGSMNDYTPGRNLLVGTSGSDISAIRSVFSDSANDNPRTQRLYTSMSDGVIHLTVNSSVSGERFFRFLNHDTSAQMTLLHGFPAGAKYTISFKIKGTVISQNGRIDLRNEWYTGITWRILYQQTTIFSYADQPNDYIAVQYSFTLPEDALTFHAGIQIYNDNNSGCEVFIKDLMMEFGSEATPWRPAPEDAVSGFNYWKLATGAMTVYHVRDITATTWYYLLQSSTLSPPSKPTTATPSGWTTTEPSYTSGSTNSLYACEKTTFSDGTFEYSDVSLSSSYEAAKAAYNKAHQAQENLDNLKVGGRNLLLNSSFSKDTNHWVRSATDFGEFTTEDGKACLHISGAFGVNKNARQDIMRVIDINDLSTTYVVSAEIKLVNYVAGTTNPYVAIYIDGARADNNAWMGPAYLKGLSSGNNLPSFNNNGWVRVWTKIKFNVVPRTQFVYIYARDFTGDLYVRNYKMEYGDKATDWTPAPEDLEEKVDNLDSSLNSQGVFNRLTNNGALQGIFMEDGNLYINMSYLKTGALVVKDSSDNEIARFDATNKTAQVGGWEVNAAKLSASDSYGYKCEVSPLNSDFHKERTYTSSGRTYAEKQGVSVGHEIITDPTEGEEAGSYSNVFSAYKLVDSETSTPGSERVDYQGYVITDDMIVAKRVHGTVDNSEIETDLIYQEQVNYTTKEVTRTFNGDVDISIAAGKNMTFGGSGDMKVKTQSQGDNSPKAASTAYVDTAMKNVVKVLSETFTFNTAAVPSGVQWPISSNCKFTVPTGYKAVMVQYVSANTDASFAVIKLDIADDGTVSGYLRNVSSSQIILSSATFKALCVRST